MKKLFFFLCAGLLTISWIGCGNCCTIKGDEAGSPANSGEYAGSPASIKSNLSYFEAVIDSVVVIDDTRFEVNMRLSSVKPAANNESIAEPGQHVRAIPQFVTTSNASIDAEHQRNKNLMSVRTLSSGSMLKGSISLSPGGRWMLIDVHK